ncbi:MAG: M23 family metallopeptidase [Myxococcales bacterium]|nr:M23 family metallopeptidase [Myxococcales bacterium]
MWLVRGLPLALAAVLLSPNPMLGDGRSTPYVAGSSHVKSTRALEVVMPNRWLPSKGRECIRKGRHRGFCQGPRRVPEPHGAAAELAEKLGLGTRKAAGSLLISPPKPEWVEAAGPGREESLLWPVAGGKLWRGFGRVTRGAKRARRHKGVDIGAPDGTLLRASKSGVVAYSDNGVRGYGNLLITIHGDGSVAFYAHCRSIYVFPGQRIERGQIVGEVGHTGIARGSHLHYEYRERGRLRDPMRYFEGAPE